MLDRLKQISARSWFLGTAAAVIVLVIAIVLIRLPPSQWEQAKIWGASLQEMGAMGAFLLVVLGAAGTAVGLPRQLVAFISGFAFGVLPGLLVSLMAATIGCMLTFLVARHLVRVRVQQRYPKMIAGLDWLIVHDPFLKILVLRLQPLGTNLLTNLCAGLTAIPLPLFLTSSLIGFVPQTLVFNLIGSGIRVGSNTQLMVSVVLLFLSLVIGAVLYRRHIGRKVV